MTVSTKPTPLIDDQIAEYYREGYLVVRQLATDRHVRDVLALARQHPVEPGGKWTPKIFDHDNPQADAALHQLLTDPRIVGAVEQIFEAPPRILFGMLAVVPAQGGQGLEWHQDSQYTHVLGRALNAFVAVDDITPDMAILWIAPRSHLWGLQRSDYIEGHHKTPDPPNGMPLPPMKQGDVCLFDRYTLHRSHRNTTDRHRYAYAAQYMEDKARLAETGEKDPRCMTADELAAMRQEAGS
jgi:ectoine hydroxylase-related dioxygenase (phytanoyl-CoA dioxygenase family)